MGTLWALEKVPSVFGPYNAKNAPDSILSRPFTRSWRRVTFHTLRHSCASALIASGAPITEVQHRLGHANPAITLMVYSHFLKHAETMSSIGSPTP